MRAVLFLTVATLAACQQTSEPSKPDAPADLRTPNRVADQVDAGWREVLENADSFELLSLFPSPKGRDKETWKARGYDKLELLHGYPILGKSDVAPARRRKLVQALYDGIGQSDGTAAACFNPRHGLRARKGETVVEAVICFQCLTVMLLRDGERVRSVTTTQSAKPTFVAYVRDAGLTEPDK